MTSAFRLKFSVMLILQKALKMFVNFLFSSSPSNCAMEPTNNFQCGHCDKDFAFENELKLHFEADCGAKSSSKRQYFINTTIIK